MATIDIVRTDARYDLRDVDTTLYTDAELLAYANRALRQLDNVLSALNSDWVLNEKADISLVAGNNSVSSPTGSMVIRSAWISSTEIIKVAPQTIYNKRKYISGTGQPRFFSEAGTSMIFEKTADDTYTIKGYYDKRATVLTDGDDMPYNDEFNDPIREMIVILGHKRNENDVFTDTQLYNFFMERVVGNVVRRNHVPARKRLDF